MNSPPAPSWQLWPALLLAPLLALLQQSVVFAMVGPACAQHWEPVLHGLNAAFLIGCATCTALAWRALRQRGGNAAAQHARQHFLARVSLGVGALSTLASLAMAAPPLWLPLCLS